MHYTCKINDHNYDPNIIPLRFHYDTRNHPAGIFLPPQFPCRELEFVKFQGPFHDLKYKQLQKGGLEKMKACSHTYTHLFYTQYAAVSEFWQQPKMLWGPI